MRIQTTNQRALQFPFVNPIKSVLGIAVFLAIGSSSSVFGQIGGDGEASIPANYQKVILDGNPGEAIGMAIASDNRVFFTTRTDQLTIYRNYAMNLNSDSTTETIPTSSVTHLNR